MSLIFLIPYNKGKAIKIDTFQSYQNITKKRILFRIFSFLKNDFSDLKNSIKHPLKNKECKDFKFFNASNCD